MENNDFNNCPKHIFDYISGILKESNKYKQALDEIEKYCKECNLKADFTACDILGFINKLKED